MRISESSRSWIAVLGIAALLAAGTWALVRYAPPPEGASPGARAPDYRVVDLAHGDSIALRSAYTGHVTLVNIWATWCIPCQEEMPSLERLYEAYRARGFRVAATSIDDIDPPPVLQFAHQRGITFDILQDRSGRIQQAYRTVGVPESFVIDRHGTIRYVSLGADRWDSPENRARIEQLLDRGD